MDSDSSVSCFISIALFVMLMLFHDQEIFSSVHCNVRATKFLIEGRA